MGRLASLHDLTPEDTNNLHIDATWYFPEARKNMYPGGRYVVPWPSSAYPYSASIHALNFSRSVGNFLKIEIRNWIELNLQETVILTSENRSYRKYYANDGDYENSYEVPNYWYVFNFDNEHSLAMFTLKFGDLITPISTTHPEDTD